MIFTPTSVNWHFPQFLETSGKPGVCDAAQLASNLIDCPIVPARYRAGVEHVEGRLSVAAALKARQREFQVVLISQGTHEEKVREVLELAEQLGVPVRRVAPRELEAVA